MGRTSRVQWVRHVARWRKSGLTARQFAAENQLKWGTLRHWAWQLNQDRKRTSRKGLAALQFIEMSAAPGKCNGTVSGAVIEAVCDPERIEVVLGKGVRIRVPDRFDEPALRRLLDLFGVR